MKIREIITELRSHPDLNVKQSPMQYLQSIPDRQLENLYISMTSIDKLGVNPRSLDRTPIAIYAYQAYYVVDKFGSLEQLPHVGDQPYVNIFNGVGNLVELAFIEEDSDLYDLLLDTCINELKKYNVSEEHVRDQYNKIKNTARSNARVKTPGGIFWFMTYAMAYVLSKSYGTTQPLAWTRLFRRMGIDGIIDDGDGIIHPNEPYQTAFFNIKSIKNNKRMLNKWSTRSNIISDRSALINKRYANMSVSDKIYNLKRSPDDILLIKNPTKDMQLAAIEQRPNVFTSMKYIDPEIQEYFMNSNFFHFELALHSKAVDPKIVAKVILNKYLRHLPEIKHMLSDAVAKELYLQSNKKVDVYTKSRVSDYRKDQYIDPEMYNVD